MALYPGAGTLPYMSPEFYTALQAGTSVLDPDRCAAFRNDVYCLGATVFAVLTGTPPPRDGNSDALEFSPGTAPRLASLIRSMVHTDPAMRPTAAAVAGDPLVLKHMCEHIFNSSMRHRPTQAMPTVSRILRGAMGVGALNQSWRSFHLKCAVSMRAQLARLGIMTLGQARELADARTVEQVLRGKARQAETALANAPRQGKAELDHVARVRGRVTRVGASAAADAGVAPPRAEGPPKQVSLTASDGVAPVDALPFLGVVLGAMTTRRGAALLAACAAQTSPDGDVDEDAGLNDLAEAFEAMSLPRGANLSAAAGGCITASDADADAACSGGAAMHAAAGCSTDLSVAAGGGTAVSASVGQAAVSAAYGGDAAVSVGAGGDADVSVGAGGGAADTSDAAAAFAHAFDARSTRFALRSGFCSSGIPESGSGAAEFPANYAELPDIRLMSPKASLPHAYPVTPGVVVPAKATPRDVPSSRKRRLRSSPPVCAVVACTPPADAASVPVAHVSLTPLRAPMLNASPAPTAASARKAVVSLTPQDSVKQRRVAVFALVRAMYCWLDDYSNAMAVLEAHAAAIDSELLGSLRGHSIEAGGAASAGATLLRSPAVALLPVTAVLPHIRHEDVDDAFVARVGALEGMLHEVFVSVSHQRDRTHPFELRNALTLVKGVLEEWNGTVVVVTAHKFAEGRGPARQWGRAYSIDFRPASH